MLHSIFTGESIHFLKTKIDSVNFCLYKIFYCKNLTYKNMRKDKNSATVCAQKRILFQFGLLFAQRLQSGIICVKYTQIDYF